MDICTSNELQPMRYVLSATIRAAANKVGSSELCRRQFLCRNEWSGSEVAMIVMCGPSAIPAASVLRRHRRRCHN
jgi:hypothetical protein